MTQLPDYVKFEPTPAPPLRYLCQHHYKIIHLSLFFFHSSPPLIRRPSDPCSVQLVKTQWTSYSRCSNSIPCSGSAPPTSVHPEHGLRHHHHLTSILSSIIRHWLIPTSPTPRHPPSPRTSVCPQRRWSSASPRRRRKRPAKRACAHHRTRKNKKTCRHFRLVDGWQSGEFGAFLAPPSIIGFDFLWSICRCSF